MAPGSGRKVAQEWAEFTEFGTKVKCRYCDCVVSKRAVRIKDHLKKCKRNIKTRSEFSDSDVQLDPEPPTKVIRRMTTEILGTTSHADLSLETSLVTSVGPIVPEPSTSKRTQSSIFSYGVVTTASQKRDLDKDIAKFFYANNIAFNVSKNAEFKRMIQNLRPGYVPPNREQLSGNLLNEVCDDVEENLRKELLSESTITLVLDGWSNTRNDPVFACNIHTGKKSYLFKAVDCGTEKKTSEYCAAFAEKAIKEIKEKYTKDVFAICTDNENKMTAMSNILNKNHPYILTYGCSAHILNLCGKEIMPSGLMKYVLEVQKYFKNKHNAHGWLREKGGLMPQIPNDTRWNSQEECLRTFIKNFHKYCEIRLEHIEQFEPQIGNILGVGIYTEAVYLRNQLKVIAKSLDTLQSDNATLSTAVEIWMNILEDPSLDNHLEQLKRRFNQHIEPFHFLAHMTDPKYFGARLTSEQEEKAELWINKNYPDFLTSILKLKIKDTEIYPALLFSDSIIEQFPAKKWWNLAKLKTSKMKTLPKGFCDFLIGLHSCPPTSASIERIFSTYGFVWNKMRNCLGADKAEKLVKVYKFLKYEPNDW